MALHIPFENLPSPILFRGDEHIAYRDPAAVAADGWLHLFFTLVETEPDGGVYMYPGKTKSRDLCKRTHMADAVPRHRPQDESVDFDRNASIGLAWSHDLERWHWPGEAGAATAGCL